MFIRKRWTLLFLVGSAVAYTWNNYKIGGLDQLRLERRPVSPNASETQVGYGGAGYNVYPQASPQPINSSRTDSIVQNGSNGPGVFNSLPPWTPQLNVGEKLALIEERLSQKASSLTGGSSLPFEPPLALPTEYQRSRPVGTSIQGDNAAGSMVGLGISDSRLPRVRVATFNAQSLGTAQLAKPHVFEAIVGILRQFDVIGLQSVQSDRDDILPVIVERLNQSGRHYDYLVGPRVGRGNVKQQFAFVFDTGRVDTDRYQLYTVDDPEDLVAFEPLVAWFRCREVPTEKAFTFSLVNLKVSPDGVDAEQRYLGNLIHAVVNDGRREDDVIVLGDFGGNPTAISSLNSPSVRHALRDVPTDVSGERSMSGILFPSQATCEYTGRSGVYDFLRKYNLSLERALEVSGQLPVWAEFLAAEGAEPGRVAPN